jgi:histidinol-phosphate/aromatic aminotransferase/cobyric acid decarboxylase-like protein/GNAT superfamily N-acetyltransferase
MLVKRRTLPQISIRVATEADREVVYRLRHDVYAEELGQHAINAQRRLTDALDSFNTYIVGEVGGVGGEIGGFISITPPRGPGYSIDKYFRRAELPLSFDDGLYELRLLTVVAKHRQGPLASLLMREAFRWVRDHGGRFIVIIGRRELVDLYRRVGLKPLGRSVQSGAVTFDLMAAAIEEVDKALRPLADLSARLDRLMEGKPGRRGTAAESSKPAAPCDHGGAFFAALGDEFDQLATRERIINADVLDAWFDPAPEVAEALRQDLPWMLKTSPPTGCDGFLRAVSRARGVPVESLVPGAGSSALIFTAFQRWLTRESRVLVLDPMYGEYAHVLEHVVGCRVDRLRLSAEDGFRLNLEQLGRAASLGYDLVVLVNPNNPTGRHVPAHELQEVLERVPRSTRVWIDETYAEYVAPGFRPVRDVPGEASRGDAVRVGAGARGDGSLGIERTGRKPGATLEAFAAVSENVIVCKSLSKVLALSGVRVAYLCAPASVAADLRGVTPPWAVSLPAQVAAVAALKNPAYYAARYEETHRLRAGLARELARLGLEVFDGVINSVLCRLPEGAPTGAEIVAACRGRGVFVRDCSTISPVLSPNWVRVAVKDASSNERVVEAIRGVLNARG